MLMGPNGFLEMKEGVVRAAPHVHMSPDDAAFHGVKAGRLHEAAHWRAVRHDFRPCAGWVHADFRLEVHIDTDEGNACALQSRHPAELLK